MKSLKELIVLAVAVFDKNTELQTLYATEDGQFFVDENRANLHADNPKKEGKKAMKVYLINRADVEKQEAENEKEETKKGSSKKK